MMTLIGASVLWHGRAEDDEESRIIATHRAVRRVEGEVKYRAVTEQAALNGYGWPSTISSDWFGSMPPQNHLVPADRPWMEVASGTDASQIHPTLLISTTKEIPAFWYNPANGIVRARVGPMLSDRRSLEIYNAINRSGLSSLFAHDEKVRPISAREAITEDLPPVVKQDPVINVRVNRPEDESDAPAPDRE